jgi:hypothetical protein
MAKCTQCERILKEDDELIVCNGCGLPYHANCWNRIYECRDCGCLTPNGIASRKKRIEQYQQDTKTAKEHAHTAVNYAQGNINNTLNSNETGMFANVGEKLKTWAKVTAVFGVISGIITVIAMLIIDEYMLLAGVVAGVIEVVSAWAMALILYAFGELVTNSKESKKIQQQILDELRNKKE